MRQLRRKVLLPLLLRRSGDASQLRWLAQFEQSQLHSVERIRAMQLERLQRIVEHAYVNCPSYQKRLRACGISPTSIQTLDDVQFLPILEKHDLQHDPLGHVASNWPADDLISNQTGGSTGAPVRFFSNLERQRSRAAATIRHNRWAGWEIGDRAALLWGAPRDAPRTDWRNRLRTILMGRQLWLDAANVTEDKLWKFHDKLQRFRPKIIQAYSRCLLLFAQFLQTKGLEPFRPSAIVISAEGLEPAERNFVERTFGAPIYNRYGCREFSVIASECRFHNGLHVMAEGLYVEIIKDGRPARPGEMGSIVITDLLNYGMPFIRYRIGDVGCWATGSCACGRGLPRLQRVHGRVTDFLIGDDGRLVSGVHLATYVIAQKPSLGRVQIIQKRINEITYRIAPARDFRPLSDLPYLETATRDYLGMNVRISYELVSSIQSEPSGKLLFSRSMVTPDFLRRDSNGCAISAIDTRD